MSFYDNKRILVTGGTGFVGTNFLKKLCQYDSEIIVPIHKRGLSFKSKKIKTIKADLSKIEDCLEVCHNVDHIFHLCGMVSAARMTVINPMTAVSVNVIVTLKILEAAMKKKVKSILLFSSGTTGYPAYSHAVKEEEMFDEDPADIYYGYGWGRRFTEIMGKFAAQRSNLKVALCRPTATYGPHDDFDPKTSHVIPALIRRAISRQNPFVVWGTGEEIRDILYVQDLVEACLILLEKKANCEPINIGSGEEVKIKELVSKILEITENTKIKVIYDANKPTTIPIRKVDISKAKKMGFKKKVSLSDGLKETIDWYKKIQI